MIYGFISSLDDETTKVFFRSKKIRVNNIYSAGSLGALTSVLQSGDVVYTVSCNRFASVRQVYTFTRFCHERGIILHFVAEPYLGLEGVGSHSFRKGFATNVYVNNHYNIELVRTLLQHSSVNVTQRYIGIGSKELEDAIQKNVCLG